MAELWMMLVLLRRPLLLLAVLQQHPLLAELLMVPVLLLRPLLLIAVQQQQP